MEIHSKVPNQAFRDNFDAIFGKKTEDKKSSDTLAAVDFSREDLASSEADIPNIPVGTLMPFQGKIMKKTATGWEPIASLTSSEEADILQSMQGR